MPASQGGSVTRGSKPGAILQPPLPAAATKKIAELFGALEGVGLDEILPKPKQR